MVNEKPYKPTSGWLGLLGVLTLFGGAVFAIYSLASGPESEGRLIALVFTFVAMLLLMLLTLFGFLAIPPNSARVLLLFGEYKGSVKKSGFFWVNLSSRRRISL
jgi:hypothetical protein